MGFNTSNNSNNSNGNKNISKGKPIQEQVQKRYDYSGGSRLPNSKAVKSDVPGKGGKNK